MSVDKKISPQADFIAAWVWVGFGLAVMIAAWRMDRLESQGASLYTAPGLVPGILGAVLLLFGLLLAFRAARAGGQRVRRLRWAAERQTRNVVMRVGAFLALALAYAAGLVGRGGIPFWLATFVFVSVFLLAFDWTRRRDAGQTAKGVLFAVGIGAGTAFVVSYVFQEVFLVRLP
ncbi:MAG: tripartite tricarboxylate transporter TctB family protein [Burkholderiaceae bacterium]